MSVPKILIVDDDTDVRLAAKLALKQVPYTVHAEENPECIPTLLKNVKYDAILLDMNFTKDVTSGKEGFFWLQKILDMDPATVVVLITAYGDVETAVKAIKHGASDFILKPWQNEKLLVTVASAIKLSQSQHRVQQLEAREIHLSESADQNYQQMIGKSSAMQNVLATIEKVAKTDASVLILGENGTGKELVARAIHRHSNRAKDIFIDVDMGAIPESLFESELFGYVKGAFTDARQGRAGKFEAASGGTLFLDEIGNLSVAMQAKLLRVLENREVIRVGSNRSIPLDIRLICATNQDIQTALQEKTFREDFLYRINTVEIKIPPLRERYEDIPLLVDFFIDRFSKKYAKPVKRIEPNGYERLQSYAWPGNIRELRHTIERTVILHDHPSYKATDFLIADTSAPTEDISLDNYNLEDVEKILIRKALTQAEGNISKAAKTLGLTRTSLYRRINKYGL